MAGLVLLSAASGAQALSSRDSAEAAVIRAVMSDKQPDTSFVFLRGADTRDLCVEVAAGRMPATPAALAKCGPADGLGGPTHAAAHDYRERNRVPSPHQPAVTGLIQRRVTEYDAFKRFLSADCVKDRGMAFNRVGLDSSMRVAIVAYEIRTGCPGGGSAQGGTLLLQRRDNGEWAIVATLLTWWA